jgi:UDP-perosamine 4-acetyltransferase
MRNALIFGGGGHAKALLDALSAQLDVLVMGVLDNDRSLWGGRVLQATVLGGDDLLPGLMSRGAAFFAVGVGGVADNGPRSALFEMGLAHGLSPLEVVHPQATVSPWASVGRGCQILAGAAVCAGARLGLHVLVNTGSVVEHDCQVRDHAHIASGAVLCGGVTVGPLAHVGAGAVVLQGRSVGPEAVVGAGAVVARDVPGGTTVIGNPARTLRRGNPLPQASGC